MEDETNREVYIKGLVKICSRPKRGKAKRGREGERAMHTINPHRQAGRSTRKVYTEKNLQAKALGKYIGFGQPAIPNSRNSTYVHVPATRDDIQARVAI
jgi:hypothetical protein